MKSSPVVTEKHKPGANGSGQVCQRTLGKEEERCVSTLIC
jgi:hypothetical protein